MPLAELERLFLRAARREAPIDLLDQAFLGDVRLDARVRMDIYAGAFFARQLSALRDFYPKTAALLGEAFLPAARRFILTHPGREAAIERMTHGFPSFLARSADVPTDKIQAIVELAELELARNLTLVAPPVANTLTLSALMAGGAGLLFQLHSEVRIVLASVRVVQLFDATLEPKEDSIHLLFTRPEFAVEYRWLEADEGRALERLRRPCSLPSFCEEFLGHSDPHARVHRVLSRLLRERALCQTTNDS
jgi:hypothetical protein